MWNNLLTKIAIAGVATVGATVFAVSSAANHGIVYPQTLVVDEVSEELDGHEWILLLRDSAGHGYIHVVQDGDFEEGELVAAIMDAGGTGNDVTDDRVLTIRYTGFQPKQNPVKDMRKAMQNKVAWREKDEYEYPIDKENGK